MNVSTSAGIISMKNRILIFVFIETINIDCTSVTLTSAKGKLLTPDNGFWALEARERSERQP